MTVPVPSSVSRALLTFDRHERQLAARAGASHHVAPNAASYAASYAAPYAALADGLARELEPLFTQPLPIPDHKARLTRIGGRCPVHRTLLEFDPFAPHDHRCRQCNMVYRAREHDEWWAMGAQLWTIERAVHAATLFVVRGDTRYAELAATIVRTYANRYASWPNVDNVLGPSRLFFSTYLESIWLLNACHAIALLESYYDAWSETDRAAVRNRLLSPASALIAGYHEGQSNRQVWNEVAILSAWRLLGHDQQLRFRLRAPGGFCELLEHGLLPDGTWYEGENYHLFAHRGLWYGVELMRALHEPLSDELNRRYSAGFVAPFLGVLPDDTFPSRRDSQYGSSIRQWRTAEWCELGWAHSRDPQLAGILTRMYRHLPGDSDAENVGASLTARAHSTADAERNYPSSPLTRADLSWRALLMAGTDPVPAEAWVAGSTWLPAQGLAILRRDNGHTYVALEGGQLGGGHGHPDQLALTLQTGNARWLQDPGTGSYTSPDLFWYRSTLAHTAPCIDETSQRPVAATTHAFTDYGTFGWIEKKVNGIGEGVTVTRRVVVATDYCIDVVDWHAEHSGAHTISLPIAGVAQVVGEDVACFAPISGKSQVTVNENGGASGATSSTPAPPSATSFMHDMQEMILTGGVTLHAHPEYVSDAVQNADIASHATVWYAASVPATLQRATVPGAPGRGDTQQHRIVCQAVSGRIVGVWCWPRPGFEVPQHLNVELSPQQSDALCTIIAGNEVHTHALRADGWHIGCVPVAATALSSAHYNAESAAVKSRTVHLPYLPENASGPEQQSEHLSVGNNLTKTAPPIRVPRVAHSAMANQPGQHIAGALTIHLGAKHYVQTEATWNEAGQPTAELQLASTTDTFTVDIVAHTGLPVVRALGRENPLDNERSAVNCDGVQWYMAEATEGTAGSVADRNSSDSRDWSAAGIHVPVNQDQTGDSGFAEALIAGSPMPETTWRLLEHGWAMRLTWPISAMPMTSRGCLQWDLVVNECVEGRERRRGQLVFSGGGGFGYLAGDRRPIAASTILQFDL